MKKIAVALIIITVLLICLWLARQPSKLPSPDQMAQLIIQKSNLPPTSKINIVPSKIPEPTLTRPAGVDDAGWNYLLLVRKLALSENQPVKFYARVLDQNNSPVANAKLSLTLTYTDEEMFRTGAFLHMKMGDEIRNKPIELFSDNEGWIKLSGISGSALRVNELIKEGYFWEMPQMGSFSYEPGGKRRVGYTEMETAFDASKGYIFHLWKKGETERLMPITIGVNLDNEAQGGWVSNYFIQFIPPKVAWTNFTGVDMVIHGVRHDTGNIDYPYEFTFTLAVLHGGLLIASDKYPYNAPTNGYENSWSFKNMPAQKPPDYPWTKTAYFKLRDGKWMAGMRIGFCNGAGFNFSFNGYINPGGSHNLEPDPEKLIANSIEIQQLDESTREVNSI